MSQISDSIREMFLAGDTKRDAGLTTPANIDRYDDLIYGANPKWQSLDVYMPKGTLEEKMPVIVNMHGGGWVYGTKETYQFYCMNLAQRGFKVVNYTYRLAPDYKFPSAFKDTNYVMGWIKSKASKYGFDLDNLFAVGDSAGANLLGVYSGLLLNPERAKDFGFTPVKDMGFKAIALNHGDYDVDSQGSETEESFTGGLMADLFANGGTPEERKLIRVTDFVALRYPPVYMASSSGDFLKDQPIAMVKALTDNTVPFIYRFFTTEGKTLDHVFHIDIKSRNAKILNDEECNFFKTFI